MIAARHQRGMNHFLLVALALLPFTACPATAQEAPDPSRLKADVGKLAGFGARRTSSAADDPARGMGAAQRWAADELTRISDACGGCITSANIARTFAGPGAPDGVEVVDVLGFQQGSEPRRVIIIGAHIGSDATGSGDAESGVALVLEAARILSRQTFRATILYAILSGEERGMFGSSLLADTARQRHWTVSAMLGNDLVGGGIGRDGIAAKRVRVISGGLSAPADRDGDDSPSQALAKAADAIAATIPGGLDVIIDRQSGPSVGGDGYDTPFRALGYPAIRFTAAAAETSDGRHADERRRDGAANGHTGEGMDFDYLAKVTAINIAMARRLAAAPLAPSGVSITGATGPE